MSIKTWKKEFYPSAALCPKTIKGRIKHSLRKWLGLLPKNLKKHNLKQVGWSLVSKKCNEMEHNFIVDGKTCSLCRKNSIKNNCKNCIFTLNIGRCDEPHGRLPSLYSTWVVRHNPEPMIKALWLLLKMKEAGILREAAQ